MPIRNRRKPIEDQCSELWTECNACLVLAAQLIERGEASGMDMLDQRETWEAVKQRVDEIGWVYYPDRMPPQVVE